MDASPLFRKFSWKWRTAYRISIIISGCILLASALGKLGSLFHPNAAALKPNPVFHYFSNSQLALTAAVLELLVCAIILRFRRRRPRLTCAAVLWVALLFLLYRVGLHRAGVVVTCDCFGMIGHLILGQEGLVNAVAKWSLVFMLISSLQFLVFYEPLVEESGANTER